MSLDPQSLRYSREHEWLALDEGEEDGALIGITDFAQTELGDIVYIDLPAAGTEVKQFEKFGEVESVKSVSDLFSPISGEVIETNAILEDKPEHVNEEPYGDGWMLRLRLTDRRELDSLLSLEEYEQFLESEAG
jgi:glycine cleavage system H protein